MTACGRCSYDFHLTWSLFAMNGPSVPIMSSFVLSLSKFGPFTYNAVDCLISPCYNNNINNNNNDNNNDNDNNINILNFYKNDIFLKPLF